MSEVIVMIQSNDQADICVYCRQSLHESKIGAGDGTGNKFMHPACFRLSTGASDILPEVIELHGRIANLINWATPHSNAAAMIKEAKLKVDSVRAILNDIKKPQEKYDLFRIARLIEDAERNLINVGHKPIHAQINPETLRAINLGAEHYLRGGKIEGLHVTYVNTQHSKWEFRAENAAPIDKIFLKFESPTGSSFSATIDL